MEQPRPNRDDLPAHLIRTTGNGYALRKTWCTEINRRIEAECIADTTCIPCLQVVRAECDSALRRGHAAHRLDQLTRDDLAAVDRDALHTASGSALDALATLTGVPRRSADVSQSDKDMRILRGMTVLVPAGPAPSDERSLAKLKASIQTEIMAAFNTVDPGPVTIAPPAPPPRCSFVPAEGLAAIVLAESRGGTTSGDIRALRDRFGCKAVSTHEILGMSDPLAADALEDNGDPDPRHCCADHVGHVLSDRDGWVSPIGYDPFVSDPEPPGVSIVPGGTGIARAGFGAPITPCQDDTVAGWAMVNRCIARESAAFGGPPISPRDAGFRQENSGPSASDIASARSAPQPQRLVLGTRDLCSDNPADRERLTLQSIKIVPGADMVGGRNVRTLEVSAVLVGSELATLRAWAAAWRLVEVDDGPTLYAIASMEINGDSHHDGFALKLMLRETEAVQPKFAGPSPGTSVPCRAMGETDESLRARIHVWLHQVEPEGTAQGKLPIEHTVILRDAVRGETFLKCYDPTITRLDHERGEMRLTTTCSTSTMWWLREQYEIGTTLAVEAGSGFSSGSARIAAFAERSGGSYDRVVTMTIHALNVQPVGAKP